LRNNFQGNFRTPLKPTISNGFVGSKTDLFMESFLDSCEIIFKNQEKESKIDPYLFFFKKTKKRKRALFKF